MKPINLHQAASRPLAVANELTGGIVDADSVFSKTVVLTGDANALRNENGRWCLLDALRLLSRVAGYVLVVLPDGCDTSAAEVLELAPTLWSRHEIVVQRGLISPAIANADAVLFVGNEVRPGAKWTAIRAQGWTAHCSSQGDLDGDNNQANPIASMMAASLGVTEIFKHLYNVPASAAPPLDRGHVNLFDFRAGPESSIGPELPRNLPLPDTALIGGGAIGNAIALLLSQLPVLGRMHIVDKQVFGDENLGTCVLLDHTAWLGQPKAECLANWLNRHSSLEVTGKQEFIAEAIAAGPLRERPIELVLNGLDDIAARHDAQRIWATTTIDGALNSVGAAVVTHRVDHPESACLRCAFRLPAENVLESQVRLTGLALDALAGDQGRLLSDEDITAAEPTRQAWLREQRKAGRTLCSVIAVAQAEKALGIHLEDGFRPSVPFVASAAAALVIAQMVKVLVCPDAEQVHTFQLGNLFLGPEARAAARRRADPACECVRHRRRILALQDRRRSGPWSAI
jgi:molybdopterin/thiamine biosynthesis adenylyltransferase